VTPDEFREAFRERGITKQRTIAAKLDLNEATVSRWLSGKVPIPSWVSLALRAIRRKKAR
jgi:hypothetical protein